MFRRKDNNGSENFDVRICWMNRWSNKMAFFKSNFYFNYLINSMEQNSSWEDYNHLASQKEMLPFTESRVSLPCSQKSACTHYFEPVDSSIQIMPLFCKINFNIFNQAVPLLRKLGIAFSLWKLEFNLEWHHARSMTST